MPQHKNTDAVDIDLDELPELSQCEHEYVRFVIQRGLTHSEAYRKAFDAYELADSTVWSKASRLQGNARIQRWIQALRSAELQRAVVEYEDWLTRMQAIASRAEQAGNYGAAVNALDKVAKAGGLYIERYEHVGGDIDIQQALDVVEQLLGVEARQKAARSLGLDNDELH